MSGISTHILDTSLGRPAAGIEVTLERFGPSRFAFSNSLWQRLVGGHADADGRIKPLLAADKVEPGIHRLTFLTGPYFSAQSVRTLYPEVSITFTVLPGESAYHIPLLLNPFGYTTYRGT